MNLHLNSFKAKEQNVEFMPSSTTWKLFKSTKYMLFMQCASSNEQNMLRFVRCLNYDRPACVSFLEHLKGRSMFFLFWELVSLILTVILSQWYVNSRQTSLFFPSSVFGIANCTDLINSTPCVSSYTTWKRSCLKVKKLLC